MVNIGGLQSNNDRRGLSFIVFVGIIGFSVARAIATFFTNYLWFESIDLTSVWFKILLTKTVLVAVTSLIAFAFIFINLRLAVRATPVMDIFESFENQDPVSRFRAWTNERFLRYRLIGAIGLSLFLGAGASQLWEQVLLFLNHKSFGITDPVFNYDISTYVFGLPLYRLFVSWGFQLVIFTSLIIILFFVATGAVQLRTGMFPDVSLSLIHI